MIKLLKIGGKKAKATNWTDIELNDRAIPEIRKKLTL